MVAAVGIFFRFFQLNALPPGLDETAARVGLQSLAVDQHHLVPLLVSTNNYAPIWVYLQALSIHAFGHTALALNLWPALLGSLSVVVMWLWLRSWFDLRVAWVGAFIMAVSPWAVTMSRSGLESALLPLLVPLTLWLSARALHKPTRSSYCLLATALVVNLLSGPIGWLLTLTVLAVSLWRLRAARSLLTFNQPRLLGAGLIAIGLALLGYLLGRSWTAVKAIPHDLSLASSIGTLGHNALAVALMFNVHGDENYRHNLAGEPMLNAFLGLMMVAGLLVSISRLHRLRYRVLLMLTLVLLIPAVLTTIGVPNSSWAAGALPLIFALSSIGTAYMLELWYATFPINSAARATGQAAIILLLALSLLQGYTQYFSAWAGSTPVYAAYNEGAVEIAHHLVTDKPNGERFVVLPQEQDPVVQYLNYGNTSYKIIAPADIAGLPLATGSRDFYIVAASRDDAVKVLKTKFAGGVLHPHYSSFNLIEIYYTYEVSK
jgi:4-amino-4-deoxy-L-arabinose transferase-like glycosyltransferase